MYALGAKRSVIRELFEYGKKRKAEIGADKVFDFSLGNPSVKPPKKVEETLKNLLLTSDSTALHGYTSAQGDAGVRQAIAEDLNRRFGTHFHKDNFYITCGAAAALTISLGAVVVPECDEVIGIAPFFAEYAVFAGNAGAKFVIVPPDRTDFQVDFDALSKAIGPRTRAVMINSPNNPSGVVYSEETIKKLAELLTEKSAEFGHAIVIISDEPYRELVYDGLEVPFVTKYYPNTIVCYSYSKSLSLPG